MDSKNIMIGQFELPPRADKCRELVISKKFTSRLLACSRQGLDVTSYNLDSVFE